MSLRSTIIALLTLVTAACGDPVALPVQVYGTAEQREAAEIGIELASDAGLPVYVGGEGYGLPIVVTTVHGEGAHTKAKTLHGASCQAIVLYDSTALSNPNLIVHELGHVLGLGEHNGVRNHENFMKPVVSRYGVYGLNAEQIQQTERVFDHKLANCNWNK